jgi:hypothetical protein
MALRGAFRRQRLLGNAFLASSDVVVQGKRHRWLVMPSDSPSLARLPRQPSSAEHGGLTAARTLDEATVA